MLLIRLPPEWGVEPVPAEKRVLRGLDLFVLWSSLGVGLLVLQAGALLVPSLTFYEALAVSLVGSIVGSFLLAAAGVIGSKYGVPTMVSLRPILGLKGSYLPTALNVVQLVGWTAFELMIMVEAAVGVAGEFAGPYTRLVCLLAFTAWCALLALGGPLAVVREWLEKFAIWLVYASTFWITFQVFTNPELCSNVFSTTPTRDMPASLALDLVIAMPISWMPLVSDYSRFAGTARGGFLGTLLGYTVANTWFYALGAALALATRQELVVSSILLLFLGSLAMLPIIVDETDNAFADIYSAAVSLQNAFPKVRQWKFVAGVAALGALLAYAIPLAEYEYFLLMIGALFIPLFGVVLADYFVVRRGEYELREFYEAAPQVRAEALFSWAIGALVYFAITYLFPEVGASLPSLLTSFGLHAALARRGGRVGVDKR